MGLPTRGELFSQLTEHLRKAQECTAMLAHITRDNDKVQAQGWLGVSELIKKFIHNITQFAVRGLQ